MKSNSYSIPYFSYENSSINYGYISPQDNVSSISKGKTLRLFNQESERLN